MWKNLVNKAKGVWSNLSFLGKSTWEFDGEVKTDKKKYKCQICNRMIDEEHAIMHIKTEEYIINLIKKDHPFWKNKDITCPECIEYYQKLVREAEI